eukprot:s572_g9.t3
MVRGSEAKPHALLERDGGEALLGKRAVIRSVRYVYQPMEALNLVVITNKASNILEERSNAAMRSRLDLSHVVVDTCSAHVASQMSDVLEDLETLRLLAKVVQDCCEIQVSEENVLKHAFDIVFAFDEVISFGYRESVTLSQIKTYTEMDSHEERLHMMVEQSKINEAREMAKKKQMELAKQRALQPKDAAGPGFGSDSLPGIGPSSMGGGSFQDTMPSMGGGASFGNDSTAPWTSSMVEDKTEGSLGPSSFARGGSETGRVFPAQDTGPAPLKPGAPKKGMALGKKKNADVLGSMGLPEPTPSPEAVAEEPAAAPAYNPLMDPVRVDIEEKITADLQVEGGLEGEAVCTGQFQVTVLDASKADLAAFRLAPQNQEFRYKIHPNLNKTSHANNVLEVREASRAYRANAPVPLVKWQYKSSNEEFLPVQISCWPSTTADGTQIVVELELTDTSVTLEESSAHRGILGLSCIPESLEVFGKQCRFVMPCCCILLVAAVLALADAFVVPSSPHVSSAPSRINKIDRAEPMISSDAGTVFMSVLAGLIVGVAVPASSFAAESAGTEKAASTPQSRKEAGGFASGSNSDLFATYAEMKKVADKLQAAPTKADRLKASQQQLLEYAKKADYDSTGATYAEMKKVAEKLQAAPSKADRLKASQQQLLEYAKKADYDSTGV